MVGVSRHPVGLRCNITQSRRSNQSASRPAATTRATPSAVRAAASDGPLQRTGAFRVGGRVARIGSVVSLPEPRSPARMDTDRLHVGDCVQLLAELPPAWVDRASADPPFNIGYEYDGYDDRRAKAEYLAWTERWLAAVRRVLKPTGSFYVAIGDEYAAEVKVRLDDLGLTVRNWIVLHYTFGVNCTKKFNRSHAHIFYYVVDPQRFTFNDGAVRVPSARMTTYADRRANPRGKLPDDTWVLRPQEDDRCFRMDSDTWYVS